jgi:6-phosphogluconolactonase
MRARIISALCAIFILIIGIAGFSGCASGHKQFAYVIGQGTNEAFEFRVQRDGTLLPLGTPNFPVGSAPSSVVVHTSGNFLYIADFAGNDVTLLDINTGNGNLSVPVSNSVVISVNPQNVFPTGLGPVAVVMSSVSPFLYTANQTDGSVSAFTVDPGAGGLTALANFTINPVVHPTAMAISPTGNFLFVVNDDGSIAVLSIGTNGALTEVGGATVSLGTGVTPTSVVVEHSGRFLYVADPAHNAVLGFSISTTGALAPISGSPFAGGSLPSGLGADPQGAFLFAANAGSNDVSAYLIDANSGALAAVAGSPFPTGGVGSTGIGVDSNSSIVYVMNATSHDVAAFGIGSKGVLTPVAGSPFGVATAATSIALTTH